MGFIKFLYHVISIYSIISWIYNIYKIGENAKLYKIIGLPESVKIRIRIRGYVAIIYILYWIYFLFIG